MNMAVNWARVGRWVDRRFGRSDPVAGVDSADLIVQASRMIAQFEKLHRLDDDGWVYPYRDANRGKFGNQPGLPTIGYGHLLSRNRNIPLESFGRITPEQAYRLLMMDTERAMQGVGRLVKVPLTTGQAVALTSFAYNAGVGALEMSRMRRRLNRGDYDGASDEFSRWTWAGGTKDVPGLVIRRKKERSVFLS